MTEREKEERIARYSIARGACEVCGKPLCEGQPQIAHCIANTQMNKRKWGEYFMQHRLNYRAVCSLECNASCNIGYDTGKVLALIADMVIYDIKNFHGE